MWPPSRGTACIVGFGGGFAAFASALDVREANGSLTFIEGERVSGTLRVTGRLRRGGRVVASAVGERGFDAPGAAPLRLDVRRCAPRASPAMMMSLGSLPTAIHLVAADRDGDGRDEIYGYGGGRVVALSGTPVVGESVQAVSDVDGDCIDDLIVRSGDQLLAVLVDETTRALGVSGERAATGDAGDGERLAVGGPSGLLWIGEGGPRRLSDAPVSALAIADLTGDGWDEVIYGSDAGIDVWVGGDSGPIASVGAVPSAWTASGFAVLDLDDDGALDLVVIDAGRLRVGRNRGDGFIEARSAPDVAADRVLALDVDGDCADDVIVIQGDELLYLRASAGGFDSPVAIGAGRDVAAADLDGDGAQELVVLRDDGAVETWAP